MKKEFLIICIAISLSPAVFSQTHISKEVSVKLENYTWSFSTERLFVHTDKNFYTAGEIIWFKIYNVTDSFSNAAILSKIAYVEVLDDQNTAVARTKISLDQKGGHGSIELPLTAASGYYSLRAYTNWMKNFGPEVFFQKKITLVNPFKNIPGKKDSLELSRIDLFPEGGDLVHNLPSRIAFKIDRADKDISGKGYLLDEKNDTLSSFVPYKFGMGSFNLTPDKSHSYRVVFVFDDNSVVASVLPQIFSKGYVMSVDEENQKINVAVRSNATEGSEIFLVVHNRGIVKAAKKNSLSNGVALFSVDKSGLGTGVSQITVLNNAGQPVCERLFFVPPSQKIMLNANLSKTVYNNRDEVSVSVSSASPVTANLSLSVYQFDSLQANDAHDITSYVWLESELNGKVENARYYLSGNSVEIRKSADYLMLTQGWRRFNQYKNLSRQITTKYLPESAGQVISCRVTDSVTGAPAKNVQVILSIPETSYKLFLGLSNDSGIVRIRTTEFFGKGELILQAMDKQRRYRIELISPFSDQFTSNRYGPFRISADFKNLLENYSIGMQAQHIYSSDSLEQFTMPELKDSFPFYGKPDYSYLLDNYKRFTTMEEVLREYVREISVGVKGAGRLDFKLLNETNREINTDNILVTIDGIPVPDPDKIFDMDPLKVRRIDIIPKNYVLGTSVFYGLASFLTYKENHEGVDIDPKALRLDYEGLQIKRQFYSPDYSMEQRRRSRIPDLRNTLFWNPDISINQQVQFYTGDNKGKYLVVVQGLTKDGEPVATVAAFEVK